ncbi:hypothetical protein CONLIGDRAFT_636536 [Coniochaeta ligniaria NRRL 30616]|uniref:Zn(2)-C6 fungal-type domain-containing protein n=1 Tax=Coniochaeta ligniaria NRRL 30616 TaxID=1408157 RepID=A0A1J7IDC3_9PEZI|nr:hypothetical protein CONLIGDRAFT_636536 [Coniochaeta ligniaria NRRL 30616]
MSGDNGSPGPRSQSGVGTASNSGGRETSRRMQRRVAESHRKRSAQSCDLCRKKRGKCVPSPSGRGSCLACQAQDIACTYTLPRKTRFYGSVDDLSDRYRCLDAIVKAAFPSDATETASDLWHLGRRMGYNMPDISSQVDRPVNPDDVLKPKPPERAASLVPAPEPVVGPSDDPPSASVPVRDHRLPRSPSGEDVRLVRDTTGGVHYIGPSGSLQFLAQLRRLLISHNANGGFGSDGATTKFTQDDTAQALEAGSTQNGVDETEDSLPSRTTDHALTDGHSPGSVNSSIAQDFTKPSAEEVQDGRRELPPPQTMELLLQSYWKHVHQDYPLFHRGTFEEEYEVFRSQSNHLRQQSSAADTVSCDWGWFACLRMMLVFGSVSEPHISGIDHITLRRQCVAATRRLLPQLVSRCTLSSVRALILLSIFLHNNNERNASWVLLGAAVRAAIALGLHKSSALSSFRPMEREVRKSVFCTLYGFEQFLASSLGRPSGLNDVDIEVNPPKGGLLDGSNTSGDQLMELSSSLHEILAKARVVSERPDNDSTSVDGILHSLETWVRRVSAHRSRYIPPIRLGTRLFDFLSRDAMDISQLRTPLGWQDPSHLRETLLLHAEYRYVGLLVTRSSLLKDVAASRSSRNPSASVEESNTSRSTLCLWHACQLAQIILLLESFDLLNGVSGPDVFYGYSAAMVIILQLLRWPSNLSGPDESGSPEDETHKWLQDMVSSLKGAVSKVEKSSTMRRFALVMTKFQECVSNRQPHRDSTMISHNQEFNQEQMPDRSSHYFPDPFQTAGTPTTAAQTTMTPQFRYTQASEMPLVGMSELTTFSAWPSAMGDGYGGMSDSDLWMGPGAIMNSDGSSVEWREVESLLSHMMPSLG